MLYQRANVFRIFSNGWSWNIKIPLCQAVNKVVLTFATVSCRLSGRIVLPGLESLLVPWNVY